MATQKYRINEKWEKFLVPLSAMEFDTLKESIIRDGCLQNLFIADGELLDGHHRHRICMELGIDPPVRDMSDQLKTDIDKIDFIVTQQLGRRNLTDTQRLNLLGQKYKNEKARYAGTSWFRKVVKSEPEPVKPEDVNFLICDPTDVAFQKQKAEQEKQEKIEKAKADQFKPKKTRVQGQRSARKVAKENNVSPATVRRSEKLTDAIEKIATTAGVEKAHQLLSEDVKRSAKEIIEFADTGLGNEQVEKEFFDPDRPKKNSPSPDLVEAEPATVDKKTFMRNRGDDTYAKWVWNPISGCGLNCEFCNVRDEVVRIRKGFSVMIHKYLLDAPANTELPPEADPKDPSWRRVIVGEYGDMFHINVPDDWVRKVLKVIADHPEWTFILQSRSPLRFTMLKLPKNVWIGASYTKEYEPQYLINIGKEIRKKMVGSQKLFLTLEPLLENYKFPTLECFDWIQIGGQGKTKQVPEKQPEWEWVESILNQARNHNCRVYFKPSLKVVPREVPE